MLNPRWYAVNAWATCERGAVAALATRSIEAWAPSFIEHVRRSDGAGKSRIVPVERLLFPRYVLVRADLMYQRILPTFGLLSFVQFADVTSPIPDEEIAGVEALLDSGAHLKLVREPQEGDPVRVTGGPFIGLLGRLLRKKNGFRWVIEPNGVTAFPSVEVDAERVESID